MHPSAQKVADAAQALGLDIEIVEFAQTTRSAQEAADAIGCDVAQIVKSLCFVVNGRATICLVSGANQLDERKLAALAGVGRKQVSRADAEMVKAATGFTIGGVPPFGHVTSLPVYIDEDLKRFEVVWAAAGTPFAVFAIRPEALERVAGGTAVSLKKE
ncbi:MAG: YbaK/EbsC family protein [Chloroflexi bacterium]|nr:YbaK/EbsC family protein [Chloroflexota bacterium]MBK8930792.1 YbaK/EbsC family protein [Chloroflexota bacterium]